MKSSAARWLAVSLALAAGSLLAGPGARAQEMGAATLAKIEPGVMENTRAGVQAELFVVLEKQADLAPAAKLEGKLSKGTFVYQTLFQTAQEAQKPIRDLLDARGVEYRPFYLVNAILVEGDRTLAQMLAARPDVRRIEGNPEMRQALPEPEPTDPEGPDVGTGKAVQKAEPGIEYVRAPQVWDLGYTGQGVVVAGADTGYRWTHAALKKAYRGWNGTTANHDYNWHDAIHRSNGPCKGNSPQPCDDFGHGTHTLGGAALLLSAFPSLAGDVDEIESRLTSSAHPIPLPVATCTSKAGAVPNNVYGFGRLDMGCAVPAKVSGSTTLCSGGTATLTANLVGKGPWTLTWSDGFVQSGVLATPATRSVSPTATTTYSLTRVASAGCAQPGAGSATVSIAAPLTGGCGETLISSPSAAVAALLSWRLARAALPIGPGIL
jgi:subtilisin family serine protease